MTTQTKNISICGVDEAGRGAFAGPLVVACVHVTNEKLIKKQLSHLTIRDSKTLSERQREAVYESVCKCNIIHQTITITVKEINEKGIGWANTEGIKNAVLAIFSLLDIQKINTDTVDCIVDGYFPAAKIAIPGRNIRCQVDADASVFPVMLAGIMAKVTRDRVMKQLHSEYEYYDWKQNKGYGTRKHIEAIRSKGICVYHRKQFVETALKKEIKD